MPGKIKAITFPDGQTHRVEEVDFDIVKEDWSEYKSSIGLRIRMKQIVQKIYWIVDEKDNRLYTPQGDPVLVVMSSNQVVPSEG